MRFSISTKEEGTPMAFLIVYESDDVHRTLGVLMEESVDDAVRCFNGKVSYQSGRRIYIQVKRSDLARWQFPELAYLSIRPVPK